MAKRTSVKDMTSWQARWRVLHLLAAANNAMIGHPKPHVLEAQAWLTEALGLIDLVKQQDYEYARSAVSSIAMRATPGSDLHKRAIEKQHALASPLLTSLQKLGRRLVRIATPVCG